MNSFTFSSGIRNHLCKKRFGKRYVGGKLENFEPGDLVLIGKNIPHYYLNNEDDDIDTDVIVIHFGEFGIWRHLILQPRILIY